MTPRVAANAPNGILRTAETISKLQQLPIQPGMPLTILQYFGILLKHGKLNKHESLEICRLLVTEGTEKHS